MEVQLTQGHQRLVWAFAGPRLAQVAQVAQGFLVLTSDGPNGWYVLICSYVWTLTRRPSRTSHLPPPPCSDYFVERFCGPGGPPPVLPPRVYGTKYLEKNVDIPPSNNSVHWMDLRLGFPANSPPSLVGENSKTTFQYFKTAMRSGSSIT